MSQYHPGRIRSHARILNVSIHLQLQQTGDENGGTPDRHLPSRCENPNPTGFLLNPNQGFADPAPPEEDNMPSADKKSLHTFTSPANRGQKRWSPGSVPPSTGWKPNPTGSLLNLNVRFVYPEPPGADKMSCPDNKFLHTSTPPQAEDEHGGPPRRYRQARGGRLKPTGFLLNPNLSFADPALPGKEKMPFPNQKSIHTSTSSANQGRKLCPP